MRTYLVIADDTPEAGVALRFAARRAAKTGGAVKVLALAAPAEFVAFGGVQATMEDEARKYAEGLVRSAAGTIMEEAGIRPAIEVRSGDRGGGSAGRAFRRGGCGADALPDHGRAGQPGRRRARPVELKISL